MSFLQNSAFLSSFIPAILANIDPFYGHIRDHQEEPLGEPQSPSYYGANKCTHLLQVHVYSRCNNTIHGY